MHTELKTQLELLKREMEQLSKDWNGKTELAESIIEKIKELNVLLEELEDF